MLRFFVRLFAVIGVVVVLVALAGAGLGWRALHRREAAVPAVAVLTVTLDRPLPDDAAETPLSRAVLGPTRSLREVVAALDQARGDARIKGVVVRIGADPGGIAQVQALRAAIGRFRASGRFAYAFSESYGDFGPGEKAYYLASACDQIWLQPVGMVGLTGISAEVPFARALLDRVGIVPEIERRGAYKSAPESLTETDFTPPHREMLSALIGNLADQMAEGIAEGRHLDPAAVRALIDRGPFMDQEALDAKLVDRLGYAEDVLAAARARAGAGSDMVALDRYALDRPEAAGDAPVVALINGDGLIVQAKSGGVLEGEVMAATDLVKAFDAAAADPAVRAIVFRIDSGGGSAVASETIRRALARAREAGKPVIVSMGNTAASGGYWIAMDADRIVAEPGTLTGSIGVFGGKFVTRGFWTLLGVHWGEIDAGANAGLWSSQSPYGQAGHARIDAMLDRIYATFTQKVAAARKLPVATVEDMAQGRVWTGAQAVSRGLVDELGGLETAMAAARKAAGIAADAPVRIAPFPRPTSDAASLVRAALARGGLDALAATPLARVLGLAGLPVSARDAAMEPVVGP